MNPQASEDENGDPSEAPSGTDSDAAEVETSQPVPVVGVGASAGGLEALNEMLETLPDDTGMAFVIVVHLDPSRESHLADLLADKTTMPVVQVEDDVPVEENHVYTIPSDAFLQIEDGHLRLQDRTGKGGHQNTVDRFFESLAEEVGSSAVGMLLSGTLNDGVVGLKAIRQAGGITIVQDPETASFPEMPQAAITAGTVDLVLDPEQIGPEIARLGRHPYLRDAKRHEQEASGWDEAQLEAVFDELGQTTSIEFDHYKSTTVRRRIQRRMMTTQSNDLSKYVERLKSDPDEVRRLQEELLILVTRFFRDEEFYDDLETEILPDIVEGRDRDEPIRVWVAGCSTGQEAYSIAMVIDEYLDRRGEDASFRVFATDVSRQAIETAREGLYPASIESEVPAKRLQRYFQRVEGGYKITKPIRSNCIFAVHDFTRDPPFADVDLISCRNVVIYLDEVLQERALSMFHYALVDEGILALGEAESTGQGPELFRPAEYGNQLFKPRAVSQRPRQGFAPVPPTTQTPSGDPDPGDHGPTQDLAGEADRVLLDRFAPPAVVVNNDLEIIAFRGETEPYFRHPTGRATFSLMKLACEGLGPEIGRAIEQADKEGRPVTHEDITLTVDGQTRRTDIRVAPLPGPSQPGHGYLVVLDEGDREVGGSGRRYQIAEAALERVSSWLRPEDSEKDERIQNLEAELESTREYLQSLTERYEATNEELRSANEEALSTNEELQSTNEELETAKEELQATNEELVTLNKEMQARNETIEQINDDLVNLLNSVQLPIVMLGQGLKIRRFTDRAAELLNLIDSDVGRPLTDLNLPLDAEKLEELMLEVLDNLQVEERVIEGEEAESPHKYRLRIHPYRTSDDKIDGVVLVLLRAGLDEGPPLGENAPDE